MLFRTSTSINSTRARRGRLCISPGVLGLLALIVAGVSPNRAEAIVRVTDSNDFAPFLPLDMPTGEFDERGLSGFEFLISSSTDPFSRNDQYLISGNVTEATSTIGNNLGDVNDISGITYIFSIKQNLVGGTNFTFTVTEQGTSNTEILCWGENCVAGSTSTELLNGIEPIDRYNGIQIQVRAQEVLGSSATVEITGLTGVPVSGTANFFNETVTPVSPGTIPGDLGRRGQWMIADSNDLLVNEWELTGLVTLVRTDLALVDRTKVRLAVDLVRDPNFPSFAAHIPTMGPLGIATLIALLGAAAFGSLARRRRKA